MCVFPYTSSRTRLALHVLPCTSSGRCSLADQNGRAAMEIGLEATGWAAHAVHRFALVLVDVPALAVFVRQILRRFGLQRRASYETRECRCNPLNERAMHWRQAAGAAIDESRPGLRRIGAWRNEVRSTTTDGRFDPGCLQRRWVPCDQTHGSGQGQLPKDRVRPRGLFILSRGADLSKDIGPWRPMRQWRTCQIGEKAAELPIWPISNPTAPRIRQDA